MLMYEGTVSLIVYQAWIHIELQHTACCYLVSSITPLFYWQVCISGFQVSGAWPGEGWCVNFL